MLVALPHIEFVNGIPTALEQDSYFDVIKRNLIVFDDQMIDSSKDKRTVNVYIRGSHHRNLSVIYNVQNQVKFLPWGIYCGANSYATVGLLTRIIS